MNYNNRNKPKLSPQKRKFVEYLKIINYRKPDSAKIMKELGISRSTYFRWLRDEKLLKIAEEESIEEIDMHLPEILRALLLKARHGDMRAIKLFLERYDPIDTKNSKVSVPDMLINLAKESWRKQKHGTG